MKKIIVGLVACVMAMYASAEYKVINLVNGTNDVQVEGAILPIAIEVKSTVSNKLVSVSRLSDVDLLKKAYDVTTNEITWQETVITTNDYFTMTDRSPVEYCQSTNTYSSSDFNVLFANKQCVMCNKDYFPNRVITNDSVRMNFASNTTVVVEEYCERNGRFVAATNKGLWWTDNPEEWNHSPITSGLYAGCVSSDTGFFAYGPLPYFSTDGISWGVVSSLTNSVVWSGEEKYSSYTYNVISACYENGKYVVVIAKKRANGKIYDYSVCTSSNLVNWNIKDLNPQSGEWLYEDIQTVIYGNGKYFFTAIYKDESQIDPTIVFSSTDGINWSTNSTPVAISGQNWAYDKSKSIFYVDSYMTKDFVNFYYSKNLVHLYLGRRFISSDGKFYGVTSSTPRLGLALSEYCEYVEKRGTSVFQHTSGSIGENERWDETTGSQRSLEYGINSYGYKRYWKMSSFFGDYFYSTVSNQRPARLTIPYPSEIMTSTLDLTYSRVTNYIPHVRYEYITNRVYNVIDKTVTTVAKIVDAQCSGGVNSEEITNRVFVIGGDKLFVDGVLQNEEQSTKATLIVQ